MAKLRTDEFDKPIQALAPGDSARISVVNGSSTSVALPIPANGVPYTHVRLSASAACWLAFGPSAVDAGAGQIDSLLFSAGAEILKVPLVAGLLATHVAAITVTGTAEFTVTGAE